MVLQPWLLNQGFVPYAQIGDEHAPLLPHILSWLNPLFNNDALLTARILHSVIIFLTITFCIWVVFNKTGHWGAIACGAYFFALSPGLGFWAMWYDLAVAPIFIAIYSVITSKRLSFSAQMLLIGLLSGIGFLIKQQALVLCVIVPISLAARSLEPGGRWRQYMKFLIQSIVGFFIPITIYLLYYLNLTNDWYALWYWVFLFNVVGNYGDLGAKVPSMQQVRAILPAFIMIIPFILRTIGFASEKGKNRDISDRWWLLIIMALSAIMLYPRYSTMHWATTLPFLAMASGIACAELLPTITIKEERFKVYQQWGIYLAIVGILWIGGGILTYRIAYQDRETRILIEYDTLPELASLITDTTSLENIVLFPDDEGVGNLYYLLNKLPSRFWMMNYPWFRNEYEINRWLTAMETWQPDQIIYFRSRSPGLYPEMDTYILERYRTIHTLDWNNQVVEVKERISDITTEN